MSFASLRENKPLRNLTLLAVAALVAVIAASIAVITDKSSVRAAFAPHPLFAGLDTKLDKVDRIVYTVSQGLSGETKIEMTRGPENQWGVDARAGYPVNPALIKKTLLGVAEMEAYEPRTANPEWHRNLGLLKPEDIGSAVRIEFFQGKGERVAALLVGKVPERTADVKGEGFIYVRRDGEAQSWLARGRVPLYKSVTDWLDPVFIDIPGSDLARVTLWANTEKSVVLARTDKAEADFVIANLPEGRATRGAPVVNKVATALIDAKFDDVAPEETLEFPDSSPVTTFETFDGLRLTMRMAGQGGALWAKFDATVEPSLAPEGSDMSEAEKRAATLNARLGKWVYKLPTDLGNQLTQTMDLLAREAGPADAATAP
ncbi:MAG: DUF4340 domain-containing protein [Parvibaculum sp.]|nr:DUF4340 domain-containing protein [Parvibaculum sp.]